MRRPHRSALAGLTALVAVQACATDAATTSAPLPMASLDSSRLVLTRAQLAIEGESITYTATINNPGSTLSPVSVSGFLVQGTTRRETGTTSVSCGVGPGVLGTGSCTVSGSAAASNNGAGTGTLVPGDATFELELTQGATVLSSRSVAVGLVSTAPPHIGISTSLSSPSIVLDGPTTFSIAELDNPGIDVSSVRLWGWIIQGTIRRFTGESEPCGGALAHGVCAGFWSPITATSSGVSGPLGPGPAKFELQLLVNGAIVDSAFISTTLVSSR